MAAQQTPTEPLSGGGPAGNRRGRRRPFNPVEFTEDWGRLLIVVVGALMVAAAVFVVPDRTTVASLLAVVGAGVAFVSVALPFVASFSAGPQGLSLKTRDELVQKALQHTNRLVEARALPIDKQGQLVALTTANAFEEVQRAPLGTRNVEHVVDAIVARAADRAFDEVVNGSE